MKHKYLVEITANAMRPSAIIILLLTIISCKSQTTRQTKEDAFNVSHVAALMKIDSNLVKDIRFVRFDSSIGVIAAGKHYMQCHKLNNSKQHEEDKFYNNTFNNTLCSRLLS